MGQRSFGLIAVLTGVVALIAAAVLVADPFRAEPPRNQDPESVEVVEEAPSATSESTTAVPSRPSESPTTPEKEETTESEYPPEDVPESREAIPNSMVDGECQELPNDATECMSPEGHVVTATPTSGGTLTCGNCRDITDETDEPLLYALLVADQSAPYILWASAEYANIQLRVDATDGEDHRGLIEWWAGAL